MADEFWAAARGLAERVRGLTLRPNAAWDAIAAEPAAIPDLYRTQVGPLAAVPAVCGAVGVLLFGIKLLDVQLHPHVGVVLLEMVVGWVLTLVAVYLLALAIDILAGPFRGVRDRVQAFKLVAYAASPYWASGVFNLYPQIGFPIGVVAFVYALYLLYLGLPRLMGIGPQHRLSCFAAILLVILCLAVLLGSVTAKIRDFGGPLRVAAASAYASPT